MTRHTHAHAPAFIDTARPLPFQMRYARFIEGEGGDGTRAGDGQASQNSGQDGTAGQSGTGGTGDTENSGQNGTGAEAQNVDELPEWAQKIIRDTRSEAANHRTKANEATAAQQATLDAIAKALGLKNDDGEDEGPKPEELTAQVQAAQAQAREAAVQLAVYRTASKHDGDPDALLDSRTFLAKVADLDPSADDFGTKVDQAIKAAVDTNPKLKASQAGAHRSGQDLTGGTGEGRTRTPQSLTDAVASAYGK